MAINVLKEEPDKVALALSGMGAETMEMVIREHRYEIARLQRLLNVRDDFIVAHDLWVDFCDQLPPNADKTAFYSQ